MKSARKRRWLWAVLALAMLGGLSWFAFDNRAVARYERAKNRAIAAGLHLTAADFRRNVPTPVENAADDYRRAFSKMATVPSTDLDLTKSYAAAMRNAEKTYKSSGVTLPITDTRVRAALAAFRPIFQDVEKALVKPRLDMWRRWEDGFLMGRADFAQFRAIHQALISDAVWSAHNGDALTAKKRLWQTIELGKHQAQEPLHDAQYALRGNAIAAYTFACHIAWAHRKNKQMLDAMDEIVARPAPQIDMKAVVIDSTYRALDFVKRSAAEPKSMPVYSHAAPGNFDPFTLAARTLNLRGVRMSVDGKILARSAAIVENLPDGPWDWKRMRDVIDEAQLESDADKSALAVFQSQFLIGESAPTMGAQIETVRRMAMNFIAVTRVYTDTDKFPQWLPTSRSDQTCLFRQRTFSYHLVKDGFRIEGADVHGVRPIQLGVEKGILTSRF